MEQGANVLVDISNDGWFGRSPAALQHLYLASLRAVEQGRWLLQGTNTGISAIIDARGRVTVRGGQFEENTLWGACAPATGGHHLSQARALAAAGRRTALARHFLGHASPLTFNPSIVLMLQLSDLRARCQPLDQRFDNLWGRL